MQIYFCKGTKKQLLKNCWRTSAEKLIKNDLIRAKKYFGIEIEVNATDAKKALFFGELTTVERSGK